MRCDRARDCAAVARSRASAHSNPVEKGTSLLHLRRFHIAVSSAALFAVARAAELPAGFVLETVAEGLAEPIALQFAPDGRLFVAERGGTIRIVANGKVGDKPFAQIDVFLPNECGLLGLALDPDFERTGYVFAFATISSNEQQIVRYREPRMPALDAEAADPFTQSDEVVVIRDHLPTRGTFHSGGGLKFGPDGMLYFSIGDNLIDSNGQDLNTLAGKISRIHPDGSTPADNPLKTATGTPRAIWAYGLRNPFRFCFAPDGRLFAMDVGSDGDGRREEINLIVAGGNYGWPLVEGHQTSLIHDPRFIDPLYDYHDGGAAPVGTVYYTGKNFPEEFAGNLFHLEYVFNRLYRVEFDGDKVRSHSTFAQLEGGPVDMIQGPDGALYYTEIASGAVRRIRFADRPADNAGATAGGPAPAPQSDEDGADTVVAGTVDESPLAPIAPRCGAGGLFALVASAVGLAAIRHGPHRR